MVHVPAPLGTQYTLGRRMRVFAHKHNRHMNDLNSSVFTVNSGAALPGQVARKHTFRNTIQEWSISPTSSEQRPWAFYDVINSQIYVFFPRSSCNGTPRELLRVGMGKV